MCEEMSTCHQRAVKSASLKLHQRISSLFTLAVNLIFVYRFSTSEILFSDLFVPVKVIQKQLNKQYSKRFILSLHMAAESVD